MDARLAAMISQSQSKDGRRLSELLKTTEILKGAESQRLRTFFTSNCMEPSRDLDAYGMSLLSGDLAAVQADFARRVAQHTAIPSSSENETGAGTSTETDPRTPAEKAAAQELYKLAWGPTCVHIYGLLGLLRILAPARADGHLAIARWLVHTARVPVDGADLSGTHAIAHAVSTKPALDIEYADLLFEAGGEINNRNRYGGTALHEVVQIWTPGDSAVVARAAQAMEWALAHGASVDIADSDGMTARYMVGRTRLKPLVTLVEKEDARRGWGKGGVQKRAYAMNKTNNKNTNTNKGEEDDNACCALCGRAADEAMKRCARCKTARYCPPDVRACQKIDWPHHKKHCVKVTDAAEGFSFLGQKF
ncbi:hypothetical protein DFH06DRAFT_1034270 [Mycena polygramma]|nr:hypothetical protein DFH06DRAFT_1034270 [Mycena polygramma]